MKTTTGGFSSKKNTFWEQFSSPKDKSSDQQSAFGAYAHGFKGEHLLYCDRGP